LVKIIVVVLGGIGVTSREEMQIVLERLKTVPAGLKMSIGSKGTFDKFQLMDEVEKNTEIGQLIVNIYMENLRSFKK
jgi:hypothetical protein